jgi:hypothetical protein
MGGVIFRDKEREHDMRWIIASMIAAFLILATLAGCIAALAHVFSPDEGRGVRGEG